MITTLLPVPEAQAIPAFARKYNVNCTVCHTAPPVLNPFGQRFLENGYQLPGTEDDRIIGRKALNGVTLQDITNYIGVRVNGNVLRGWDFKRQHPPGMDRDIVKNKTEFAFPESFQLFTGGTLAKNVGFMVELEHDVEDGGLAMERGLVTFNNLISHNVAHIRVGRFDPSAYYSYAGNRHQLFPVGESAVSTCTPFTPCPLNRAGLQPSAFAAKFYGLYQHDGTAVLPYSSSLYNSSGETGVDVHGRPFGDWFLYQVGVVNGANEGFSDSNKAKDFYGMVRFDHAQSRDFSATMSGFIYLGHSNAKVQSQEDVNWSRYGLSARVSCKMVDLYAAFAIDKIGKTPVTLSGKFDSTATGLTIGVDAYATDQILLSVRYDNLDAGGMLDQRHSSTFVGAQLKYFLRLNAAIFVRNDFNIRTSEGNHAAASNLRNAFFSGIDIVF